jgi:hypothetical protein
VLTFGVSLVASSTRINSSIAAAVQQIKNLGKGEISHSRDSGAQWAMETAQQIADELYAAVGVLLQHELESPLSTFDMNKVCKRLEKQYKRKPLTNQVILAERAAPSGIGGGETTTPPKRSQRGNVATTDVVDIGAKRLLRTRPLESADSGGTATASPVGKGAIRKTRPKKKAKSAASGDDSSEPTHLSCSSIDTIILVDMATHTVNVLLADGEQKTVTYAGANRTKEDTRLTDEINKSHALMASFAAEEWACVLKLKAADSGNEVQDPDSNQQEQPTCRSVHSTTDTEPHTTEPEGDQTKRPCNSGNQQPAKRARSAAINPVTNTTIQTVGNTDPAKLKGVLQQWLLDYNENTNPADQLAALLQNLEG